MKFGTSNQRVSTIIATTSLVIGMSGCADMTKRSQLEGVARDWSETIRASQIIPVYPLTEDMQPGDVFLVQVPIDRQQEMWEAGDYLPLDNHLARINPTGYPPFYANSFFSGEDVIMPRDWMAPVIPGHTPSLEPWTAAPGAFFPTYSFSVQKGTGLDVALPISGIPIGLSLLDTSSASGTVIIRNARTVGIDIRSGYADLVKWSDDHRSFLANFAPDQDEPPRNFIRMITRVYLTSELEVSLQDSRAIAAGGDTGPSRPVDLLYTKTDPGGPTAVEMYEQNLSKLNTMLNDRPSQPAPGPNQGAAMMNGAPIPSASVRVSAAAGRSVTISEKFARPLVLGYLGFDVPVLAKGHLGPPIPTHAIVTGVVSSAPTSAAVISGSDADIADLFDDINARVDADAIYLRAATILGSDWRTLYAIMTNRVPASTSPGDIFADLELAYEAAADGDREDRVAAVIAALEAALNEAP